jgi:chloramphenicol-sensitive protein RarD
LPYSPWSLKLRASNNQNARFNEAVVSKGIVLSVLASSLFGVMYYYTSLLYPLSGAEIFGWRMLLTLPCMTVFMCFSGDWRLVPTIVTRLRQHPRLWIALLASSALVGLQLWLFLWAPLNGHSLDVSLGYFLLPLTMILTGRVVYGEHLSHLQKIAAALATFGVANEVYRVGGFSWTTLVVAIGYPLYFVLRKRIGTDNLGGLWMDMLLLMPAAFLFVQTGEHGFDVASQREALYTLIPLLGLISALALISYIMASRMLAFSLFGLLSYVEPVLLVCVALLLGESISAGQWLTYLPIWLAVMVLVFEGFKHMVRQRKSV